MRSLRRKRVSLFPKNQKTKNQKKKKKKKLKEQSNPIQFRSIPPACEPRVLRVEVERETILKSPENKKVFRFFFSFFIFDWNQFKLFSRKAARQKASTGLEERIWSRLQSVSIRYICVCVCAHNRYYYIWKINPFGYPGKYSHAYAQICWQLFRWISINPRVPGKPMWEHRSGISTHRDLCSPA